MSAPPLNWARLDLRTLRLAAVCAEAGSLTAAAPLCHLSVTAASGRLRRLEEALGGPLFLRSHAGLTPTCAGRQLARAMPAIVAALESMAREVRAAA